MKAVNRMDYDYDPNFDPSALASDPRYSVAPEDYKAMTSELSDEASEMEEDEKPYCICRKPEGGTMIRCEQCLEWYHIDCIKIDKSLASKLPSFICHLCNDGM